MMKMPEWGRMSSMHTEGGSVSWNPNSRKDLSHHPELLTAMRQVLPCWMITQAAICALPKMWDSLSTNEVAVSDRKSLPLICAGCVYVNLLFAAGQVRLHALRHSG